VGGVDILVENSVEPVVDDLVIGLGAMVPTALTVAEKLAAEGRSVRAVDPVWALPVSAALVDLARTAERVTVIEDNLVSAGVGTQIALALADAGVSVPVRLFGIPKRFLDHASRGQVLEEIGLTADPIASSLLEP
jgi:1-deoxy-D-xylulose-5-phosphate synthase